MYKYILAFIKFILPIAKQAALEAAVDVVNQAAYPRRAPFRSSYNRYTNYNRIPRTQRESVRNVGRAVREAYQPTPGRNVFAEPERSNAFRDGYVGKTGYHDVVMVAFDVSGIDAKTVHEWIHKQMPDVNDIGEDEPVHIDSWWVANDLRFDGSDTDSAVFVSKGAQQEARELLRKHSLVN